LYRIEVEREHFFLFVGYPFRRKGVDILIQAFSRLRDRHPQWRLVLVGFNLEGPAQQAGLDLGGVEFLGPVPRDSVADLMARCAALVLPSRSEAMGRVLLEAAFAGCPRIGSAVTGIPRYIDHERDGLLVDPGNVDALLAALERIVSDPQEASRLGSAARERAQREFTADAYVAAYSELFASV
jgi:glycosyltransferase involved in cell wall biosynthesis